MVVLGGGRFLESEVPLYLQRDTLGSLHKSVMEGRIFVELTTSDRNIKASRQDSK